MQIVYGVDTMYRSPQTVIACHLANKPVSPATFPVGQGLSRCVTLTLSSEAGTRVTETGDGLPGKRITRTIVLRNRLLWRSLWI
jgi:hypothetical protein